MKQIQRLRFQLFAFFLLGNVLSNESDPYIQPFGNSYSEDTRAIWSLYKNSFGKRYDTSEEEEFRYSIKFKIQHELRV